MTTDAVQTLLDRIEIEKLAVLCGRGIDIDSSYFDRCMTEDVEVIYPFGQWTGLEAYKRARDATIGATFAFTQHLLTNPIIDIDGDTAKAQYSVFAAQALKATGGKDVVYAGAIYSQDLVRTPKGWRIKRHHCESLWIDDKVGLMNVVETSAEAT
jgi:hypothetical protein